MKAVETKPNEGDTARFQIKNQDKTKAIKNNNLKFMAQSDSEEEEDSEDYFEIQKEIEKKKTGIKMNSQQTIPINKQIKSKEANAVAPYTENNDMKISEQSVLRPKIHQKNNDV